MVNNLLDNIFIPKGYQKIPNILNSQTRQQCDTFQSMWLSILQSCSKRYKNDTSSMLLQTNTRRGPKYHNKLQPSDPMSHYSPSYLLGVIVPEGEVFKGESVLSDEGLVLGVSDSAKSVRLGVVMVDVQEVVFRRFLHFSRSHQRTTCRRWVVISHTRQLRNVAWTQQLF